MRPFDTTVGPEIRYRLNDRPLREAWRTAMLRVPRGWTDQRISEAAEWSRRVADRHGTPAWGWSGGKDSVVLGEVMREAGIETGMNSLCELDFAEFREWADLHRPEGVEYIHVDRLSEQWLIENPDFLWNAARMEQVSEWHHRTPQKRFIRERGIGVMFLGRRGSDPGRSMGAIPKIHETAAGVWAYPLDDWCFEEIAAAMWHRDLPVAPVYDYFRGWYTGPVPWNRRMVQSEAQGWHEVYDIDHLVVERMAPHFPLARAEIERRG